MAYALNPLQMLADHSRKALDLTQLRDLMVAVHSSLRAIEDGAGTEDDITQLAVASNIALIFAERGLGTEYIPEVKEAQRHIVDAQERLKQSGKVGLTGPGMLAIRRMLELHDEQIKHPEANEGAMRSALREIFSRMLAGHYVTPGRPA